MKAVAAQFVKLLRAQKDNSLLLTDLLPEYSKTFGYALRLHDFDVSSVPALMQKLCHVVKVTFWPCQLPLWKVCRVVLRSFLSHRTWLSTCNKMLFLEYSVDSGRGKSKRVLYVVSILL